MGLADEFVFRGVQLEIFCIKAAVYIAGIEEELMGGDGEEGAGELGHAWEVEVLQILGCQEEGGVLFRARFMKLRMYSIMTGTERKR